MPSRAQIARAAPKWRPGRVGFVALVGALWVGTTATSVATQGGPSPQEAISFKGIAAAPSQHLRLWQVRRVLQLRSDGSTQWISSPEILDVDRDHDGSPRFSLVFDDQRASGLASNERTRLSQTYARHSSYLFLHATFRVEDADRAERNYLVFYLETRTRIGRPTYRVAILPRRMGRHSWLLDLDVETGYPLMQAEYNAAGVLVSSIEATRIDVSPSTPTTWWAPRLAVAEYGSIREAARTLPRSSLVFPRKGELPGGYEFDFARVVRDDLSTRVFLTAIYSDGVDQMFIMQTLNASPPSQPGPTVGSADAPYAIFVYRDMNVAQYMFQHDSIRYTIIGSAGQFHLARIATELLEQSVR